MRKYVIIGVQGSGKGTQAKLLAEGLDLVHISVGDLFRSHIQSHTKLGAQVKRIVNDGHLVDDFKFMWKQILLTAITFGIYYPWAFSRIVNRVLTQTYLSTDIAVVGK